MVKGVGKSSVSVCYSTGATPKGLPATIGVDILLKETIIDGKPIQFQMFDPAGHVRKQHN